jgi:putative long chain acyl-CoA synthase
MDRPRRSRTPLGKLQRRLRRVGKGVENALELMRAGRLSAPYQAPHEILLEHGILRLRRYGLEPDEDQEEAGSAPRLSQPILLVPPLMVTAEVYDISPELSAVSWLDSQGVDVWVVDFGSPEDEAGGMSRTLDDHVLAIDRAVTYVAQATGHPVHLGGYSQGGMFAYLVAAYRKNADLASIITFGSPVDMHQNMPLPMSDGAASRVLTAASGAISGVMERIEGLPGMFTSTGFKLLSPKKELQQMVQMLGLMHDREALEKREPKRRFLGGEGFIGFPGPALRDLVHDLVAGNRLATGGAVVGGRSVGLSDITVPILYFVGVGDSIARPASVRAIRDIVASQRVHELGVHAGHFGIVVGSRAMAETWPTVSQWVAWHAGAGGMPRLLEAAKAPPPKGAEAPAAEALAGPDPRTGTVGLFYDLATDAVDRLWDRVTDVSKEMIGVVDAMRWQLPRLAKLSSIEDRTRISIGRALSEQAAAIPDATFFLWQGRAFTYREADEYVNRILGALYSAGVRPGQHVGLLMDNHPDYLSVLAALSRIGAVAVLAVGRGARYAARARDFGGLTARAGAEVLAGHLLHRRNLRARFTIENSTSPSSSASRARSPPRRAWASSSVTFCRGPSASGQSKPTAFRGVRGQE